VATYDGTTTKLYVNGVEKASTPAPTPGPLPETAGNLFIGKPEYSNHSFTGLIDEVALWDHALSAAEIAQQYQNARMGGVPGCPPATPTATYLAARGDQRGRRLRCRRNLFVTGVVEPLSQAPSTRVYWPCTLCPQTPRRLEPDDPERNRTPWPRRDNCWCIPAGWSYTLSTDTAGGKEVKGYVGKFTLDGTAGASADGPSGTPPANLFSYGGVEYFDGATVLTVAGTPYLYAVGGGQPCSYSGPTSWQDSI